MSSEVGAGARPAGVTRDRVRGGVLGSLTDTTLVLLALTAVGAALRFPTLDVQSLWLDETFRQPARPQPRGDAWETAGQRVGAPPLLRARLGLDTTLGCRRGRTALSLGSPRDGDDPVCWRRRGEVDHAANRAGYRGTRGGEPDNRVGAKSARGAQSGWTRLYWGAGNTPGCRTA
jgi:hypothetical protein